jgi:hypothetical protein
MRASVQSVMNTLWSRSSARTVSRSRVEWWPDSGATTSTVGWSFIFASAPMSSVKRLKRSRRQKGFSSATCCCTATSMPPTLAEVIPNSGFSYSLESRCIRSRPADTRSAIGVCAKGDSGWLYSLDEALANSANGLNRARWVSYN